MVINIDGAFKAEHLRQERSHDDVCLSDGLAYMAKSAPYLAHIAQTKEVKVVSAPARRRSPPRPEPPACYIPAEMGRGRHRPPPAMSTKQ